MDSQMNDRMMNIVDMELMETGSNIITNDSR